MWFLVTYQFYFIFSRVEVWQELIFISIIKWGREDDDFCGYKNLMLILMERLNFTSCFFITSTFLSHWMWGSCVFPSAPLSCWLSLHRSACSISRLLFSRQDFSVSRRVLGFTLVIFAVAVVSCLRPDRIQPACSSRCNWLHGNFFGPSCGAQCRFSLLHLALGSVIWVWVSGWKFLLRFFSRCCIFLILFLPACTGQSLVLIFLGWSVDATSKDSYAPSSFQLSLVLLYSSIFLLKIFDLTFFYSD
jgi:hypothetical protein